MRNIVGRIIILGLDGATFKVIDPMIERGLLPNFKRLKGEGIWGNLRSNIHPITPSAWASIYTGLNPGKHGIYDFRRLNRSDYSLNFVNGSARRGKPIWQVLSECGKKVGVVNIPLTYPPEKVNGFMVSGMDAPGNDCRYTYPEGFAGEIKSSIGDYAIDVNGSCSSCEDYLTQVEDMFAKRVKLFRYVMETKKDLDFLFFVFVETDRLQHVLWKYIDPENPAYLLPEAAGYRRKIEDIYRRVDELIGSYYFSNPKDTALMIVSDHGFGPLKKDIYLNKWFEQIGLLKFKDKNFGGGGISFLENIDWSKTKAYSYGFFGNININLRGREAGGIVKAGREEKKIKELITKKATQLIDPETGKKVVDKVYLKEELYSGDFTALAPDMLFIVDNYSYTSRDGYESFTDNIFEEPMKHHKHAVPHSGNHRIEGVFMMHFDGCRTSCPRKITLCDVFPTVLELHDLNLNVDCDGHSIIGRERISDKCIARK
ncbi:MAG: alkaline phosphatase family protein [Candidatus Omnitrophica bacterium]|nr:alkaline phosphatase family protein [Candidatus Omnitrophota bacterium]